MQTAQPSLFTRDDTFFGVCEGLGEDLGINPNLLRLALPPLLFVNPVATIAGYAAAGVLVLLTRILFPDPGPASARPASEVRAPVQVDASKPTDREPVALAA